MRDRSSIAQLIEDLERAVFIAKDDLKTDTLPIYVHEAESLIEFAKQIQTLTQSNDALESKLQTAVDALNMILGILPGHPMANPVHVCANKALREIKGEK